MGLFDSKRCEICTTKVKKAKSNTAIFEITKRFAEGTLLYRCKSCTIFFCCRCGVIGRGPEKARDFTSVVEGVLRGIYGIEEILRPRFGCPKCHAKEVVPQGIESLAG